MYLPILLHELCVSCGRHKKLGMTHAFTGDGPAPNSSTTTHTQMRRAWQGNKKVVHVLKLAPRVRPVYDRPGPYAAAKIASSSDVPVAEEPDVDSTEFLISTTPRFLPDVSFEDEFASVQPPADAAHELPQATAECSSANGVAAHCISDGSQVLTMSTALGTACARWFSSPISFGNKTDQILSVAFLVDTLGPMSVALVDVVLRALSQLDTRDLPLPWPSTVLPTAALALAPGALDVSVLTLPWSYDSCKLLWCCKTIVSPPVPPAQAPSVLRQRDLLLRQTVATADLVLLVFDPRDCRTLEHVEQQLLPSCYRQPCVVESQVAIVPSPWRPSAHMGMFVAVSHPTQPVADNAVPVTDELLALIVHRVAATHNMSVESVRIEQQIPSSVSPESATLSDVTVTLPTPGAAVAGLLPGPSPETRDGDIVAMCVPALANTVEFVTTVCRGWPAFVDHVSHRLLARRVHEVVDRYRALGKNAESLEDHLDDLGLKPHMRCWAESCPPLVDYEAPVPAAVPATSPDLTVQPTVARSRLQGLKWSDCTSTAATVVAVHDAAIIRPSMLTDDSVDPGIVKSCTPCCVVA
jgi:hypothetical protein